MRNVLRVIAAPFPHGFSGRPLLLLPPEHQANGPATANVAAAAAAVFKNMPVLASALFERVREDRHVVERALRVDTAGDGQNGRSPPGARERGHEWRTNYLPDQIALLQFFGFP